LTAIQVKTTGQMASARMAAKHRIPLLAPAHSGVVTTITASIAPTAK
jgi:hypothetical protein